jgi:glycine reductase
MRLTLAIHSVTELTFGRATRLVGTRVEIDHRALRDRLLEDRRLEGVDLEIADPGEPCRIGPIFDVIEPRAKAPGDGPNFPGVLDAIAQVGQGTTHVLRGACVTIVDEGHHAPSHSVRGSTKILDMRGPPAQASPYGCLRHLVIVPHTRAGLEWHDVYNAYRIASVKVAVFLATAAIGAQPTMQEVVESDGPRVTGRDGRPRLAYIGQVHGWQHGTEVDEHILYGGNTVGMMPVVLHPNEWLDGAVVISYSWTRDVETYMYQNHPIITALDRRHRAGEIALVGTIAMAAASLEEDRARNTRLAAQLAKWNLGADGVVLTRYSSSGAPQSDMFETARIAENLGMRTVVLVTGAADGTVESSALMHLPDVDAMVCVGGHDRRWETPVPERVIAATPALAARLAALRELPATGVCGVTNHQGASRLRAVVY